MTYIAKPKVHHPALPKNAIGLTRRDYEGSITTLCAGCGHDSITAAIIQAFWDLSIRPHHVAKLLAEGLPTSLRDQRPVSPGAYAMASTSIRRSG